MNQQEKVYSFLKNLNIEYELYEHLPIFTVEEGEIYWSNIDATHCKNLFFRDKKGKQHYLVVLRSDKQLDIKQLNSNLAGDNERLSFASPERLMKYLQLTPGSVSPFGLINDEQNHVVLFIDEDLKYAEKLSFHPNINTLTVVVSQAGFQCFLANIGNRFQYISIENS
jgi:Ala-tRNA(Pro) deacylase